MNDYSEPVGESWQYDPDYHRASDALGIDRYERDDFQVAQKMSTIRDWAASNSKGGLEDSLAVIDKLRKQIGTQARGKTLLNELYQHLRFQTSKPLEKSQSKKPISKSAPRKSAKKADPISKIVQKSVEGRIAELVAKTMTNKNVVYKAVNNVIKNIIK